MPRRALVIADGHLHERHEEIPASVLLHRLHQLFERLVGFEVLAVVEAPHAFGKAVRKRRRHRVYSDSVWRSASTDLAPDTSRSRTSPETATRSPPASNRRANSPTPRSARASARARRLPRTASARRTSCNARRSGLARG